MKAKGIVSTTMIYIVGSLIVSALIFTTVSDLINNIIKDQQYYETKLTLLGLRNNVILASTLDSGRIDFNSLGTASAYEVTIDRQSMSIKRYDGDKLTILNPPAPPFLHYTPEIVQTESPPPYVVKGLKFCVVKTVDASCASFVQVCPADNGCTCPQPALCK